MRVRLSWLRGTSRPSFRPLQLLTQQQSLIQATPPRYSPQQVCAARQAPHAEARSGSQRRPGLCQSCSQLRQHAALHQLPAIGLRASTQHAQRSQRALLQHESAGRSVRDNIIGLSLARRWSSRLLAGQITEIAAATCIILHCRPFTRLLARRAPIF